MLIKETMQKTASIENYTSEKASSSSVSTTQADHEQVSGETLGVKKNFLWMLGRMSNGPGF